MKIAKERIPCISVPDSVLDYLPDALHIGLYCLIARYENQDVTFQFIAKLLNVKDYEIIDALHKLKILGFISEVN